MALRTTTTLPTDHPDPGRRTADHYALAEHMRASPGLWVLVTQPPTRRAAYEARRRINTGFHAAYRDGRYTAQIRRTRTGRHEVWARYEESQVL